MSEGDVKDEVVPKKKLTKHQFYFETPLYESIKLSEADQYLFSGEVDAYSAKNKIDTTYEVKMRNFSNDSYGFDDFYGVYLTCKRKDNDRLNFLVSVQENLVVKVGQWPSLADIQFAEISIKYAKYLAKEELQDLKRAVGLAAHGVGAGSFVYLRRIFEKLIKETYQVNKDKIEISEEDFRKQRMVEKVNTLKNFLPNQLVEMKAIYSILSKGVHELSEQDCLLYFEPLKLSIELVLDQKIENEAKAKKDEVVKKQLANISAKLKEK